MDLGGCFWGVYGKVNTGGTLWYPAWTTWLLPPFFFFFFFFFYLSLGFIPILPPTHLQSSWGDEFRRGVPDKIAGQWRIVFRLSREWIVRFYPVDFNTVSVYAFGSPPPPPRLPLSPQNVKAQLILEKQSAQILGEDLLLKPQLLIFRPTELFLFYLFYFYCSPEPNVKCHIH